jgi:hypothetical protein
MQVTSRKCHCTSQQKLENSTCWTLKWVVICNMWESRNVCAHPWVDSCEPTCIMWTQFKNFKSNLCFDKTRNWFGFTFVSLFLFIAPPPLWNIHNSLMPPPHSRCSSNIPHFAKVRNYGYNGTYQYGQVTDTIQSKNIMQYHFFFS